MTKLALAFLAPMLALVLAVGFAAADENGDPPGATAGPDDPHAYGDADCIACSGPADGPDGANTSDAGADGNATDPKQGRDAPADDQPTYSGDCGAEMCAYSDPEPQQFGPDGCIEGAHWGEDCRADVQDFGPGAGADGDGDAAGGDGVEVVRGPADGLCENCRGDQAEGEAAGALRGASLPGAAIVATALVAITLLFGFVRRN